MSLTLIKSIVNGDKKLSDVSGEELRDVISASVVNSDFSALKILTNYYTGIYEYDEHKPYWLQSDFSAPQWMLSLRKTDTTIEWSSVTLDDGLNLTHPKHEKLLNTFKYWITAIDNPYENGGKLISKNTVSAYLDYVWSMINVILLHSEDLKLSKYHLTKVSEDFWLSILHNIVSSGSLMQGVYRYTNRFKGLLEQSINSVDDESATQFANQYPFLKRDMLAEDQTFYFSVQQRIKACYWLHQQGYYHTQSQGHVHQRPQGNTTVIREKLYDGRVIPRKLKFPLFEELWIEEPKRATEFRAIANKNDDKGFNEDALKPYIIAIKLINTTHGRNDCSQLPIDSCRNLNSTRIGDLSTFKKAGRTRTLPPKMVFNLIRQCYELIKENQKIILDSVLRVLIEGQHKSIKSRSNPNYKCTNQKGYNPEIPSTERGAFLKYDALEFVEERLIKLGVNTISAFEVKLENRHQKIRNNESLFDLYSILMGSTQTLVGAIMGRRQDELISLKSHGNLHPKIDPFSDEGLKTNFELVFKVKKTGIGGLNGTNSTIKRPIMNSIARFIWTLEQFNIKARELGVVEGKLSLFNKLDRIRFRLSKVEVVTFNKNLDEMCDYFETDLVQYENGEYRRNYIRQHQLRRFFAMCFFWSKGYDGLDSLRWMLGHSDLEHLYHYISESETGAVLSGAKASVIVKGIKDKSSELANMENIDKLEALIAKRFGVEGEGSVLISTLRNASEDYNDEDYKTTPNICQIKAEQELESQVITLLEDHSITLEPNFFTVQDENGETVNTFTLALEVKELD